MRFANRAFVAAGVGFATAVIAGCGSSGGSLLSASQSSRLSEQLNRVTQALDESDCSAARQYLSDFQSSVDALGGGVNSTLVSDLEQGASTVESLTDRDCQTPARTTTVKKTQSSTNTDTTPTQTTATFTTSSTTDTYTAPAYTTTTYSTPATTPSGGQCLTGCDTTTSTTSSTVSSTTSPTGGTGLGSGTIDTTDTTDTTSTDDTTTTVNTTDTSGAGF